jgi:hypothetical protein
MPVTTEPKKEIGSVKNIGGVIITSRRYFIDGDTKIFETVDGQFVLPNGEPVKDKALFNILPPNHKERALKWHADTFEPKQAAKVKET